MIKSRYKRVYRPDHPHAMACGCVYEHRLIMEQELGRYLESWEQVHHKDGDPRNNDPKNLVVCSAKEHALEHAYGEDELLEWLIQYNHEYGHWPTKRECDTHPGMPNSSTYRRRFGSWSEAKRRAKILLDEQNHLGWEDFYDEQAI
jgi:GTPase SAR1 family protein